MAENRSKSRDAWHESFRGTIGSAMVNSPTGPTGGELFGYDGLTQDYLGRQPSNLNPLLPTYFQFSMKRCPTVTYFCQSANLPGLNIDTIPQPTRFVDIPHAPGVPDFEDLTINFVVDETLKNWLEIYRWMRATTTSKDVTEITDTDEHYTDATLTILNSAMVPRIRVAFENMFPTSLSSLEFDSTTTAPEALIGTATFTYTTYEITELS
tara:strand:+ start:227 stop:856 length:630 start_codon:yes stop_codon:yes gene_type:complete